MTTFDVWPTVVEVLGEAGNPRPAYFHPETLAVIRRFGRDMLDVITNAELLRRGLNYHLIGFPLYSMPAVPKFLIYLPLPSWVPKRDPNTGLFCALQDIQDRYLFPKLPRTRWERMLSDDVI